MRTLPLAKADQVISTDRGLCNKVVRNMPCHFVLVCGSTQKNQNMHFIVSGETHQLAVAYGLFTALQLSGSF